MIDPDAAMLLLLGELLELGVPADAAADALRALEAGATVREAADIALDASALDVALQARAEATVLRAEIAVRDRVPSLARRKEP